MCPKSVSAGEVDHGMEPPRVFKVNPRLHGYSMCDGCEKWKMNLRFRHENRDWILCEWDYADYWENIDKLLSDYKEYP